MTSNPYKLVLFVDRSVLSDVAIHELKRAREWVGDDKGCVAVMETQYCNSVCIAHNITCVPCCLIFNREQDVLKRECEALNMSRAWFYEMITEILDAPSV